MSFLKKIFGGDKKSQPQNQRSVPRAQPNNRVSVTFPSLGQQIAVRNISVSGIAIDINPDLMQLTPNLQLSAQLKIIDKDFNIEVKVLRKSEYIIALAFLKPPPELIQEISRVFLLEFNAQNIQYIGPDKLQAEAGGTPHWFYGGENYELFYVVQGGEVKSFYLKILSDTIEKKPGKDLSFGRIWSDGPVNHDEIPKYKGSDLIELQRALPPAVIKNAASFVTHIPKLPKAHAQQIISELKV